MSLMADDDDFDVDPFRDERRSHPGADKSRREPFEESGRETIEKRERREPPPERTPDRDED